LLLINTLRVRRLDFVAAVGERAPAAGAAWRPRLIVPEHDNVSYEWLAQTRQMFAQGECRVRRIDYENAPLGRDVLSASPYRWWLGTIAWLDQAASGRPAGQSLERAALIADPLLHVLLLAGATLLVAWQFGVLPAVLLSLALAAAFPFAAGYLPGAPNDQGFIQILVLGSVLPLLAGLRAAHSGTEQAAGRVRRWFVTAGVIGGLGLWVGVGGEFPVLIGIALGGLAVAWVQRGGTSAETGAAPAPLPWLAWALGGSVTSLAGYLLEYSPAYLGSWQLQYNHPLYGLAWLGGGALLAQVTAWIQRGGSRGIGRGVGIVVLGVVALAGLPVAMVMTHNLGFLDTNPASFHLTRLPGNVPATNLWSWIFDTGFTPQVWATVLPLLLAGPAVWMLRLRRRAPLASRASLALALGPVIVAVGFACWQLRWWNLADLALAALLVAAAEAAGPQRVIRWIWSGAAAVVLLLGAIEVFPWAEGGKKNVLNEAEVTGLIERDLARWLSLHAGPGGAIVLAPHNQTITLHYYGGLRGLATLDRENVDGLGAAVRILSASTPEEAKELVDKRGIKYLVIPSWDSYLDVYARMGMGKIEGTFLQTLHQWILQPWLRPVPYQLPTVAGFEGESVVILEVVEEQSDAGTLSRIAEYFVEMNQLDLATSAGTALRRFPADVGALAARAQVENARGDTADFADVVELLKRRLTGGADRVLPLDRRVSLAIVLALGKNADLARGQVQRCLAELDEPKLRSLTTLSLYRLQVLARAYGLAIANPRLHQLALDLLPFDLRSRL
jgi:hypothetical protein